MCVVAASTDMLIGIFPTLKAPELTEALPHLRSIFLRLRFGQIVWRISPDEVETFRHRSKHCLKGQRVSIFFVYMDSCTWSLYYTIYLKDRQGFVKVPKKPMDRTLYHITPLAFCDSERVWVPIDLVESLRCR